VFQLKENGTSVKQEVLAGATAFSTMAYIIFVNPLILSAAGMDVGAVMVATILSAAFATSVMGLLANYPFAQAPGMGINAFLTYSVVLSQGHSWQLALGACFIAGIIFLLMNIFHLRQVIMHAIPRTLRIAVAGGLGLFLALIGFKNAGIIVGHPETLLTAGNLCGPKALLCGLGIVVITALISLRVQAAMLLGILLIWGLSLTLGLSSWQGLLAYPPSLTPTLLQLDIQGALSPSLFGVVLAFVFTILFDASGTLIALADQGGFLDKNGKLPRATRALTSDALGTAFGACVGTSPITTYLESASGIAAGGRTGLTSLTVAALFMLCLFFSPVVASIPLFATSPVLIIIGAMMLRVIKNLDWDDMTELVPAFLVLIAIPLTFSIARGIGIGFLSYPLIKVLSGRRKELYPMTWVLSGLFLIYFLFGE
jgi:AGZA family xanthine/uracil permease-like MFS transporter